MYDVSSPKSLQSLRKWWDEFRDRAPVREGEEEAFCCVVVGNKIDVGESKNGTGTVRVSGDGDANGDMGSDANPNGHVNGKAKSSPIPTPTPTAKAKGKWKVSEQEAFSFLEELIPPRAPSPPLDDPSTDIPTPREHHHSLQEVTDESDAARIVSISLPPNGDSTSQPNQSDDNPEPIHLPVHNDEPPSPPASPPSSPPRIRSKSTSITINNGSNKTNTLSPHHTSPRSTRGPSRSRSANRLSYGGTRGSLSSLATRENIYHTPSSSYFDVYESARSSPVPFPAHGSPSDGSGYGSWSGSIGRGSLGKGSEMGLGIGSRKVNGRNDSTASRTSRSSLSSSSALTITQSLFARTSNPTAATPSVPAAPSPSQEAPPLPPPERRPKLFFTSAKTGEGVNDVFEYVARRVVVRWEWEAREWDEEGEWEGDGQDTVEIGLRDGRGRGRGRERDGLGMKVASGCCAS
jgi:Ras-related protein Rab-7A